jgi:hypothetical protein
VSVGPVETDPTFGCELWLGQLDRDGYGMTPSGRRAHLVAYERAYGPIPSGLVLDHRCARRRCAFAPHLEAVTQSENLLRRNWKYRAKEKLCPRGHDMSTAAVTPEKGRLCRNCMLGGRNSKGAAAEQSDAR